MSEQAAVTGDPPLRKQQQRSIVTQKKLLDAAIEAFSENGYKGTSTRDIAERAGVHHPLITYHFKNKDRLWRAAAHRVFGDYSESLTRVAEDNRGMDLKTRAASAIRAYVYYAKSRPAMHKMMVQESSYPNPRLDWLVATHIKPFFDASFNIVEKLQELGVAPAGNPALLFNMIRMVSGGLLALRSELKVSSNIDIDSSDTLNELIDMIVNIFLPGDMPARDDSKT